MSVRGSWEAFFVFANGANRAVAQPKGVRARPRLPVSIQWSMHGHVMSETSLSLARALAELAQARRRGKRRRALLADRTLQLLVQDLVGRAHCGRDDAAGRGAAYADDQERGVPS